MTVSASASSPAGIASVQFQLDGTNLGSAVVAPGPYSIQWSTVTAVNGPHTLTAIATDTQGQTSTSAGLAVTVSNAAPAGPLAAFVMKDTATGGTWKGRYGQDGAIIASDSNYPPAYVTPTISGAVPFTWAITQDPRALQQYAGNSRTASTFYASPGFSVDLNFKDGNAHQLALYFLDWDNSGRSETVTIVDPATQQTLNVQTISNFQQGAYLVWNITGHVRVQVLKGAGPNAVVSGIFFAPAQ
ncbi:MAG: Ig-like domain-containing protein [Bryobacteraceae bacterium]